MAYRLEGKDIVIDGFEQGIADTPYKGIADMRNVEIIGVPGEGSVNFENTPCTVPPVYNAVAFTAQATGDTITVATTAGLYAGCAIVLNTNTATGISTGVVYYVGTITATTFQLFTTVANALAPFMPIDITGNGSGTLTTYQYGDQRLPNTGVPSPKSYYVDTAGSLGGTSGVYILDGSNYAWFVTASTSVAVNPYMLYFLGNIGGAATTSGNAGIAVWNGYVLIFGISTGIDIARLSTLFYSSGPTAVWDYTWENYDATTGQVQTLVSQEDGNLYFTTDDGLGSLSEEPGEVFNPTDTDTYNLTSTALLIPATDRSISITELGAYLYIGGINSLIYPWDKISPGFNTPLVVPETYQSKLVATDQNLFIFPGNRGNIYISNGASVELYKKVPDYVTGIVNPYIQWRSASFLRREIVFSFTARNNASAEQDTVAGVWAINTATQSLRMLNKLTPTGYAGVVMMAVEMPRTSVMSFTNQIPGTGLLVGWYTNVTFLYGIDRPTSNVYDDGESFIETDMIPIGTYLSPFTPSQIEWKTSVPLGANGTSESIAIYYRTSLNASFTLIDSSTSANGTINGVTAISDLYKANFQKVQWVQFRIVLTGNSTTPTYNRLTEIRVRDFPSATNPQ